MFAYPNVNTEEVSASFKYLIDTQGQNDFGRVDYDLDGTVYTTNSSTGFELHGVPAGTHTISIYAVDNIGNISDPLVHTWSIDTPAGYTEYTSNSFWAPPEPFGPNIFQDGKWKAIASPFDMTLTASGSWPVGKIVESMIINYSSTDNETLQFFARTANGFNIDPPSGSNTYDYVAGTPQPWYNYDADNNYPEVTFGDMQLDFINLWSNALQPFTINNIYFKWVPQTPLFEGWISVSNPAYFQTPIQGSWSASAMVANNGVDVYSPEWWASTVSDLAIWNAYRFDKVRITFSPQSDPTAYSFFLSNANLNDFYSPNINGTPEDMTSPQIFNIIPEAGKSIIEVFDMFKRNVEGGSEVTPYTISSVELYAYERTWYDVTDPSYWWSHDTGGDNIELVDYWDGVKYVVGDRNTANYSLNLYTSDKVYPAWWQNVSMVEITTDTLSTSPNSTTTMYYNGFTHRSPQGGNVYDRTGSGVMIANGIWTNSPVSAELGPGSELGNGIATGLNLRMNQYFGGFGFNNQGYAGPINITKIRVFK